MKDHYEFEDVIEVTKEKEKEYGCCDIVKRYFNSLAYIFYSGYF